jgi:hypothetical protein
MIFVKTGKRRAEPGAKLAERHPRERAVRDAVAVPALPRLADRRSGVAGLPEAPHERVTAPDRRRQLRF